MVRCTSPVLSSPVTIFDRDTTLTTLGPGRYAVNFSRDWWVVAGPNGGIVAAVLLTAAEAEVAEERRFPRTITVHYLAPPREGPAELVVTAEKTGRAVSFVSVRLTQGDRACAVALVALASDRPDLLDVQHEPPPHVPPPEACPKLVTEGGDATIRHRWETRWAIGPLPRSEGGSEQVMESGGWLRLSEPRPLDGPALVAMADAWVPPLLAVHEHPGFSVPTVELTVHLRDRAALAALGPTDWCLTRFRCRTAREGFVEEDGMIWSPEGRLLAQSRQLAIMQPLPPDAPRPSLRLEPPA